MFSAITQGITPYLLAGIAILVIAFTTYFFWSQSKFEKQAAKITAYEITIQTQQNALIQLGTDIDTIKDINSELADIERDSAENASLLADKLRGIGDFAKEKPQAVQDLINAAGQRRLRCFELATGAIPTKNETNKTCPHLLK